MKIEIHHRCSDFDSYRAARCKSLFNVESGCNFDLEADLPIDDDEWCLGLIVGPSGSGKTSIGKEIFGEKAFYDFDNWPEDKPIIDAINPGGSFDDVTRALAGVGLGSVPAWLRPYPVLSNGEKFRANLARVICEEPEKIVIDEFTSVVDRQIAKVGAHAFSKNWKRIQKDKTKQCVLLSCHYDIIDWLEPDWVYDVATGKYQGRGLWRRPKIELKIYEYNKWDLWEKIFKKHHYLKVGPMPGGKIYLGVIGDKIVAHGALAPKPKGKSVEVRGGRGVVLPEWQGLNIGFLRAKASHEIQMEGKGVLKGRHVTSLTITSHPALIKQRLKDPCYQFIKQRLHGQRRLLAHRSIVGYKKNKRKKRGQGRYSSAGRGFRSFGGHWRPTVTFRYIGDGSIKYEK